MTTTIATAIDSVLDARSNRQDFSIPLKDFSLSLNVDGDKIVGVIDGQDYVPTEYCLRQMAKWHNLPLGILRNLTTPLEKQNGEIIAQRDATDLGLLVSLFKNGIRDNRVDPNKVFKFRTYGDGTLRAMLSEMYAIVDNVWYLEHLQETFAGGDEPEFVHWSTDGDTIHGNLRIPGTEQSGSDSDYAGMLFVGNCEIGTRRLSIATAVWRQICTNGMMGWAEGEKWTKVHRGDIDLRGLASDINYHISAQIPKLASGIAALESAQNKQFAKGVQPSRLIAQIADEYNLTPGQNGQAVASLVEWNHHEKGFRNLFGLVNAITRAAQKQAPAEQHRLEEVGGNLVSLSEKEWERLNDRATSMREDKYNKILGRTVA